MELIKKLSEVMAEVGYVQKDATNTFHGYRYASAEAVLKKVNSALSERGIAVSSKAELTHYDGGHAIVRLSLTFHDGDESLTAQGLGEGSDKGDKATMKANTAALKYTLANAFMISWGDDPEADVTTDQASSPTKGKLAPSSNSKRASEPNPFGDGDITAIDAPLPAKGSKGINAVRELYGLAEILGWSTEDLVAWVNERTGKTPEQVTAPQAKALVAAMKKEGKDE
jgi:hypothetical protein